MSMKAAFKRIGILVLGWAFVLLGIAGVFLPVLPGFVLVGVGLLILSTEYIWAHRLVLRFRARFPSLAHRSDVFARKTRRWMMRRYPRVGAWFRAGTENEHVS